MNLHFRALPGLYVAYFSFPYNLGLQSTKAWFQSGQSHGGMCLFCTEMGPWAVICHTWRGLIQKVKEKFRSCVDTGTKPKFRAPEGKCYSWLHL